jgi:hypothetical protein
MKFAFFSAALRFSAVSCSNLREIFLKSDIWLSPTDASQVEKAKDFSTSLEADFGSVLGKL